eukprot:CAMPEP_0119566944 /NCGR_PEP_ID=MMETSP1352-20130426/34541_1 /TAXON_ID=265584 /ORGANISM="Stauroneis constricta, Strain CCMP1120" /LENGTH=170 /DNA_ID=CAMNT_0007616131 /DNA_START=92 /DNA_END=604 /DNA_ORIENTATION=+
MMIFSMSSRTSRHGGVLARMPSCWSHGTSSFVRLCNSRRVMTTFHEGLENDGDDDCNDKGSQPPATKQKNKRQRGTQRRNWDVAIPQPIVGYFKDEENHWVAKLKCGHSQHVRHDPPMVEREWVTTERGRRRMLGVELPCKLCVKESKSFWRKQQDDDDGGMESAASRKD